MLARSEIARQVDDAHIEFHLELIDFDGGDAHLSHARNAAHLVDNLSFFWRLGAYTRDFVDGFKILK